jgi:lysozyme
MTLYEFIAKHEGRKRKPYKCPAGYNTIGVGWNMDANPLPPDIKKQLDQYGQIDDEMVDRLLNISIRHTLADCQVIFPSYNTFSDARRMALADFVFNLGFKGAKRFVKAVKYINAEKWPEVAQEMRNSDWYRQVPNRAKEVVSMVEQG